jgi:serine protease AprX
VIFSGLSIAETDLSLLWLGFERNLSRRSMGKPSSKAVWGAVVAIGLLLPVPAAAAGQSRLDRALQGSSSGEAREVIIRVKPGRQATVKSKIDRRSGDAKVHGLIDAVSARLSGRDIAELASDPDVEGVSLDADVSALAAADKNAAGKNPNAGANGKKPGSGPGDPGIGAGNTVADIKHFVGLGNWFTGSSTTVAIIDSGIAPGIDFDTRILAQYVFSGGKPALYTLPFDDYGHGTHIAGLIGSNGTSSSNKYGGVAPGVKLLSLKVLDRKGSGRTSDVINALEFAVANRARFGIKVVNLSLGHPVYEPAATDPLVQAVEAAVRAGLVVVVAAGNYGFNPLTGQIGFAGIASPGNAPSAITVGAANTNNTAVRSDDRVADYSSRGPSWYDGFAKPDLLAPGQGLTSNDAIGSTLDRDYPSLVVKSGSTRFLRLSGSSMATAVVSGVVAVAIEANRTGAQQRWQTAQEALKRNERGSFDAPPDLTSNAIKALLEYSATPLRDEDGRPYGALEQGAGLVNAAGAIALSYGIDTTRRAGEYWATMQTPAVTTFDGIDVPWAQAVVWGTRRLAGTSVVELRQAAWEDNVVWGTGELRTITWGMVADGEDNIVWGTLADGEDNIVWGTSVSLSTTLTWVGNTFFEDNIVWGTASSWDDNVVWGTNLIGVLHGNNIVWGSFSDSDDNIVWGTLSEDNIVWGTSEKKVTVLGTALGGGL